MVMLFLSLLALSADAASVAENEESMLPIKNGDCSYFCNPVCDFKTTSFKDCKCCFLFFENCDHDKCHNYNPIDKPLEFSKGVSTILKQERRLKQSCKVVTPLNIDLSNLIDNNLAGQGPKSGPQRIRYAKVGKSANNKFFDLIVETVGSGYLSFNTANNGLSNKVGRINVATKVSASSKFTSSKFKFTFIDNDTGNPVPLEKFVFQFFDLDRDEKLTLHESICLDIEQINPTGDTDIPNLKYSAQDKKFVTSSTVNKEVSTKYEMKTCSGASSSKGSVKVTGEKVGFACDNPITVNLGTVACTDSKCFTKTACDKKKGKHFPINQRNRAMFVEMNDRSSFDAYFELECLKSVGETCTRNFEFTSTYLDSSRCTTTTTTTTTTTPKPTTPKPTTPKPTTTTTAGYAYDSYYQPYSPYEEPCGPGPVQFMTFDTKHLVQSNLGGLGPDSGAQEMRFSKVGTILDGTQFDVVVKAKDTQDKYFSFTPKEHNIAGGTGFQINLGVTAQSGKPVTATEFEMSFQDQKGNALEVDRLQIYMMDLDRDTKTTLRERGCYNLDELDLENTAIPGFDAKNKVLKAEAVLPGFAGPQLRTTYNKDKNCDGSSQTTHGSVLVEANQVGFLCDNSNDLKLEDFKAVKCNSPGCFSGSSCNPTKKKQFFGLVDKDGKTCKAGAAGCEFETGIHPATRLSTTAYTKVSSFHVSLGIECLKKDKATCTRNFVFRAAYQNVKTCKCTEELGDVRKFLFNTGNLATNNIGGLGPTTGPQEMRFKKAATDGEGNEVDLIFKALGTQDKYHSFTPKEHNIPAGKGFQVNIGVAPTDSKKVFDTEFEICFEDQKGKRIELDAVDIYLLDLDRDAKTTLRERACYDLDTLDLAGSDIPGFDSKNKVLKAEPIQAGFAGTQLRTTYVKDKNCDGTSQTKDGSVKVDANQVGFLCDNSLHLEIKDFKPVKCTDPGCFPSASCAPTKKKQFFGLVDKDGKTCKAGDAGCEFESGIHPATRLIATRYLKTSSIRVSLGIECLKPKDKTCTRNFVFRADYQNVKKKCPCLEKKRHEFKIDASTLAVNNLGGLGPDKLKAKEIRYKMIGQNADGRYFDLAVTVAPGQSYLSIFADVRNGLSSSGSSLGNINIDVDVTDTNNVGRTEFIFTIEDSLTGDEMVLDQFEFQFFDFDVNQKQNLHELVCMNLDQFDAKSSTLPSNNQVKLLQLDTKDCAGKASNTGSVRLEGHGVGFLCDNPKKSSDIGDVPCFPCFTEEQCKKEKIKKFFPIKRSLRTAKFVFKQRSRFTITLGISCEKTKGEHCNRNFIFTGFHDDCTKK